MKTIDRLKEYILNNVGPGSKYEQRATISFLCEEIDKLKAAQTDQEKEKAIELLKGSDPDYCGPPEIQRYYSYNDRTGMGYWDTTLLKKLEVATIMKLYWIVKEDNEKYKRKGKL